MLGDGSHRLNFHQRCDIGILPGITPFIEIDDFPEIGSLVVKVENRYCQLFSCSTERILAVF